MTNGTLQLPDDIPANQIMVVSDEKLKEDGLELVIAGENWYRCLYTNVLVQKYTVIYKED